MATFAKAKTDRLMKLSEQEAKIVEPRSVSKIPIIQRQRLTDPKLNELSTPSKLKSVSISNIMSTPKRIVQETEPISRLETNKPDFTAGHMPKGILKNRNTNPHTPKTVNFGVDVLDFEFQRALKCTPMKASRVNSKENANVNQEQSSSIKSKFATGPRRVVRSNCAGTPKPLKDVHGDHLPCPSTPRGASIAINVGKMLLEGKIMDTPLKSNSE